MSLKKYYNEKVEIICNDGKVFRGLVTDYIFPEDNLNGKESIIIDTPIIGMVEFQASGIQSITVI